MWQAVIFEIHADEFSFFATLQTADVFAYASELRDSNSKGRASAVYLDVVP